MSLVSRPMFVLIGIILIKKIPSCYMFTIISLLFIQQCGRTVGSSPSVIKTLGILFDYEPNQS